MHRLAVVVALSVCLGTASAPALAENASLADLQDLTDQPSRTDLFELIIKADDEEDAKFKTDRIEFFNLYGPFRFPNDAVFDVVENRPRTASIFGVDISHYTPATFPIEALERRSVKYVYAKASQGTGYKDSKFESFWNRLAKTKIHRGAYHFLSAGLAGEDQAKTFVRVLNATGKLQATDMPPVVDLEWDKGSRDGPDRWQGRSADEIVSAVRGWMQHVERETGRKPMVYTARSWIREHLGLEAKLAQALAGYQVWIADYSRTSRASESPKLPAGLSSKLWQFTDAATLAAGWTGSFDANIFKGSEDEFYATFGLSKFN